MQIPKFFLVLNVVALAVVPTAVNATQVKWSRVLAAVPASQNAPMLLAAAESTDSATTARLREAVRKALAESAQTPAPAAPVVSESPAEPAKFVNPLKKRVKAEPVFSDVPALATPSQSPVLSPSASSAENIPSAIPAGKEGRLADLLRQYKNDAISAEDYHSKRAAILSAP